VKSKLKLIKNPADGIVHVVNEAWDDYTVCGHKWNSVDDFGWESAGGKPTCPECSKIAKSLKGVKPC